MNGDMNGDMNTDTARDIPQTDRTLVFALDIGSAEEIDQVYTLTVPEEPPGIVVRGDAEGARSHDK